MPDKLDPWKTDAYRRNHSLLLQLDMGKFRSKAYDAHFIDDEEMGELASQAGTRQSHNEKLLEIGKGPGGVRTFRHLVKTVGLFGERYEEMREELEEVLKTAEGGVSGATAAKSGAQAASPAAAAAAATATSPAAATAASPAAAAAAAAAAKKPPADRSKNPWQTTEYKSKYTNLLGLMDDSDFLAKCFSLGMISKDKRVAISEVTASRRRKEELLSTISTTAKNFVKFREILRTDSIERYADYMDDLDSVGPDPTDPEYQEIRADAKVILQ